MPDEWVELKAEVIVNQGVITVTAKRLRNIYGVTRLATHIPGRISDALTNVGLGHVPEKIPNSADSLVRLFLLNSPVHALMVTARVPSPENDQIIRNLISKITQTIAIDEVPAENESQRLIRVLKKGLDRRRRESRDRWLKKWKARRGRT